MKYEPTTNGISIEFNTDSIDKLFDRFRLNYEEFKHKLVAYKENNRQDCQQAVLFFVGEDVPSLPPTARSENE